MRKRRIVEFVTPKRQSIQQLETIAPHQRIDRLGAWVAG
jgi:hypothetical protein